MFDHLLSGRGQLHLLQSCTPVFFSSVLLGRVQDAVDFIGVGSDLRETRGLVDMGTGVFMSRAKQMSVGGLAELVDGETIHLWRCHVLPDEPWIGTDVNMVRDAEYFPTVVCEDTDPISVGLNVPEKPSLGARRRTEDDVVICESRRHRVVGPRKESGFPRKGMSIHHAPHRNRGEMCPTRDGQSYILLRRGDPTKFPWFGDDMIN